MIDALGILITAASDLIRAGLGLMQAASSGHLSVEEALDKIQETLDGLSAKEAKERAKLEATRRANASRKR